MAHRSRKMLGDALDAVGRPRQHARPDIIKRDDEVDELHESVFRILLTHMMEDPSTFRRRWN